MFLIFRTRGTVEKMNSAVELFSDKHDRRGKQMVDRAVSMTYCHIGSGLNGV